MTLVHPSHHLANLSCVVSIYVIALLTSKYKEPDLVQESRGKLFRTKRLKHVLIFNTLLYVWKVISINMHSEASKEYQQCTLMVLFHLILACIAYQWDSKAFSPQDLCCVGLNHRTPYQLSCQAARDQTTDSKERARYIVRNRSEHDRNRCVIDGNSNFMIRQILLSAWNCKKNGKGKREKYVRVVISSIRCVLNATLNRGIWAVDLLYKFSSALIHDWFSYLMASV